MNRTPAKHHSRAGVSIFYALLFLMVASMVAVVILDASVTATKRLREEQEAQQATLTLASGSKLIRQMLEQSRVTITETTVTSDEGETVPGPTEYTGTGPLGLLMADAVGYVSEYSPSAYDSQVKHKDIKITVTPDDAPDAIGDVTMRFTMVREEAADPGILTDMHEYVIHGTLSVDGSDEQVSLYAWMSSDATGNPRTCKWTVTMEGGAS